MIFEPWRSCRNRRQVPETGSSTPTVNLPGVAWPVTRVIGMPVRLPQLGAFGAQMCVWK